MNSLGSFKTRLARGTLLWPALALLTLPIAPSARALSVRTLVETVRDFHRGPRKFDPIEHRLPKPQLEEIRREFADGRPVLIVTDTVAPQNNGVVNTVNDNMIKQLDELGIPRLLVTPDYFDFKYLLGQDLQNITAAWAPKNTIRDLLVQHRPNRIHVATPEGTVGSKVVELLSAWGIPFTTAYHTQFPEYLNDLKIRGKTIKVPLDYSYAYMRAVQRNSERILVPTKAMIKHLVENGFDPKRLALWSRGVDTSLFFPRQKEAGFWERLVQLSNSQKRVEIKQPVMLYVGRVVIEKNIEAFLRVKEPGGTKIIVGADGGDYLEYLKQTYPEAIFINRIDDKQLLGKVYSQADVMVFPSLTDTFGNVQLEAAAAGTPVAAYSGTQSFGVIQDNVIGAGRPMVEPGQAGQLGEAISEALQMDRSEVALRSSRNGWEKTTLEALHYMVPLPASIYDQFRSR